MMGEIWYRYKNRGWSLGRETFEEMVYRPCHYCGRDPYYIYSKDQLDRTTGRYYRLTSLPMQGIDRIDSSLGYVAGNVVPCCPECNGAKSNRTAEQFIELCKLVAAHNQ